MPYAGEHVQPLRLQVGAGQGMLPLSLAGFIALSALAALGSGTALLPAAAVVAATVVITLALAWRQEGSRARVISLVLQSRGTARLRHADGSGSSGDWPGHGWVSPWLCVLLVHHGGRVSRLPVWRHRQAPGEYRRLRVRCIYAGSPPEARLGDPR